MIDNEQIDRVETLKKDILSTCSGYYNAEALDALSNALIAVYLDAYGNKAGSDLLLKNLGLLHDVIAERRNQKCN